MSQAIIVGGGLAGRATALAPWHRAGIGSQPVYEAGAPRPRPGRLPHSRRATAWTRCATLGELADAVADGGFADAAHGPADHVGDASSTVPLRHRPAGRPAGAD